MSIDVGFRGRTENNSEYIAYLMGSSQRIGLILKIKTKVNRKRSTIKIIASIAITLTQRGK